LPRVAPRPPTGPDHGSHTATDPKEAEQ